jgi:RNA-binding protein YhbY
MEDLKRKAKLMEATIRLGKTGLSEGQIGEIRKQLDKRKLIKIKMLRSFVLTLDNRKEIDEIPNIVANLTGSTVVLSVGNAFALAKGQKRK